MAHPAEIGPNPDDLASALRDLEKRVARIEDQLATRPFATPPTPLLSAEETPTVEIRNPDRLLNPTLIGRTFIVLGGGYLLRAFTESGAVSLSFGVVLGILYATVWLMLAARGGALSSATCHGIAGMLVGHPLLWEAATRFKVMLPEVAAFGMALVALAGLAIAWRRHIAALAWVSVLGGGGALVVLAVTAKEFTPSAAALLVMTLAAVAVGADRTWRALSWPAFALADFVVLASLFLTAIGKSADARATTTLMALALFVVSLSAIALAKRLGARELDLVAMAQAAVALPIGLTGAALIAGTPDARLAIGVLAIVAAILLYLAGWFEASPVGVGFYMTLGFVVGLHGGLLTFPDATAWMVWSAIGLLALWRAGERAAIAVHASIALAVAAIASGLAGYAAHRIVASDPARWPPLTAAAASAFAVLLVAGWRAGFSPVVHRHRLAQILLIALICWCVAGFAIDAGAAAGAAATRAGLAALRTAVVTLIAVALAATSRVGRLGEAVALVTPLLLLGGAKLIIEDFRVGSAATLFVSLACYGAALVIAPMVVRKKAAG